VIWKLLPSFLITNLSDEEKTLIDFVSETKHLLDGFNSYYGYKITAEEMLAAARGRKVHEEWESGRNDYSYTWRPHETRQMAFGDEDGDCVGLVFDYMLRDGGKSDNFEWQFHEYWR
jgi:hypothetical protein